ncbi:MAG: ParB/RepB/Spo0J family partition protein [Thiotrichales bacterium]|nr:ParB/RepB/Spo0J family partition protein [Thiotrichales bacterium]MCY4349052.1 ParB/RepB/Spo0J family partition protein [Thiotrichales bacterium]
MSRKRGLGRGLDALLGNMPDALTTRETGPNATSGAGDDGVRSLPIDLIHRGRHQPRRIVEESALEELAHSVRSRGIVQPIVVRPLASGGHEIVAGERRWRAAQMAGLREVPVVVREYSDSEAAAVALIENIQREDLNPIEEAEGYRTLADEFGLTHQELADTVGRSRSSVSNTLRLLELDFDVRTLVEQGELDMGHARALLALSGTEQSRAATEVVRRGLSARETERLVRSKVKGDATATGPGARDPDVVRLETELSERLGAKVRIDHKAKGRGSLTIHYSSLDALDGILERIR